MTLCHVQRVTWELITGLLELNSRYIYMFSFRLYLDCVRAVFKQLRNVITIYSLLDRLSEDSFKVRFVYFLDNDQLT